ncbi:MAG: tRNA (N(6)-L-threonylcarbamoyladenosine(37)-C(2))-methylthiotransferase MtaB [Clostridiales bacterium]|nr:tRNA (N(6)-L-threonylcarbamoyladenosine(37)-C(2))-methylthiotransferase MtaB [Clostridiales bacterium]
MKAAIYTLGCKVNRYESEVMAEKLIKDGYELVPHSAIADIYIINSCSVTAESDRKTRQAVRKFKRQNPSAVTVLTGCVPQAFPGISDILPEADIVLGNRNNGKLTDALNEYFAERKKLILTEPHESGEIFEPSSISGFIGRTRAEVKIEDGCNRFCSYCIIPYARGRVRSKKIEDIKSEVSGLADAGFTEIVLVGINLSAYNDNGKNICDAVETASSVEKIKRVRLGSLEPDHLTDDVIERLSGCEKLCPHFHISLQSGCDKTLKAMNRHYSAEEYEKLCQKLRSSFKDAALTTDVMVGFAGESEEDFSISKEFVKRIGFEKVHVFPYSIRPGTKAASFPDQVEKSVKERRCREMTELAGEIRAEYLSSQIGKTVSVLIETNSGTEKYKEGFTANYIPVKIEGECPDGGIVNVRITGAGDDHCIGTYINEK